jgi:hypothetical protein
MHFRAFHSDLLKSTKTHPLGHDIWKTKYQVHLIKVLCYHCADFHESHVWVPCMFVQSIRFDTHTLSNINILRAEYRRTESFVLTADGLKPTSLARPLLLLQCAKILCISSVHRSNFSWFLLQPNIDTCWSPQECRRSKGFQSLGETERNDAFINWKQQRITSMRMS